MGAAKGNAADRLAPSVLSSALIMTALSVGILRFILHDRAPSAMALHMNIWCIGRGGGAGGRKEIYHRPSNDGGVVLKCGVAVLNRNRTLCQSKLVL